jgi:hypothetical protein
MRDSIKFLAFLIILFFGVGEFAGGWHVGMPPQSPVWLYKKSSSNIITRRTVNSPSFPFTITGELQQGAVMVEAWYERPTSFQNPGQTSLPLRIYYTETFAAEMPIRLEHVMNQGQGIYTLRLTYQDATGSLRVRVPPASQL